MPRATHDSNRSMSAARGTRPPGLPAWITPELVERTIAVWQPYYSFTLSVDDAVEILRNCASLLDAFRSYSGER